RRRRDRDVREGDRSRSGIRPGALPTGIGAEKKRQAGRSAAGFQSRSPARSAIEDPIKSKPAYAFRNAKYHGAFDPSMVTSNRCNNKIIVPHRGMRRAEEFSACSDHDELLP